MKNERKFEVKIIMGSYVKLKSLFLIIIMGRQKYLREKVNQLNHLDIDQPLLILGFCKNHPPTHPPYWTPYPNAVNVISEALTLLNHDQQSISPSVSQSVSQSLSQSLSQSFSQSVIQSVS